MIYQVRTFQALCHAKKYFHFKQDIKPFLDTVVYRTREYRTIRNQDKKLTAYPVLLSKKEIAESIEITMIDEKIMPDWQLFFSEEKEICKPDY